MKKIKLLRKLLCITACCCVAGGMTATLVAQGAEAGTVLEQSYSKNDSIRVPEKKIAVNGKQYATSAKVVYPDGSTKKVEADEVKLSSAGLYTVVYYVVIDGNYHEETVTFTVNEDAYTINGKKSTVYYGHHNVYATDENGLVMSIAQNESVQYNKIVDLKKFSNEPVINLFVTPEKLGTQDASVLKITFTDIYDPSNSIELRAKRVNYNGEWAENNVYTQVGSSKIGFSGLEPSSSASSMTVLGGHYALHSGENNEYGSPINFSLCGYLKAGESIGDRQYQIIWDYEEQAVYQSNTKVKRLISELDNSMLYNMLWEGFTTGEVFVSFSADNYTNDTMNLVVTQIGDYDLSEQDFTITEEPVINIDFGGYESENLPYAMVNMPYEVFDATAWDFYDGVTSVTARVYYNYYGNNPHSYAIKDGKFIPDRAGIYTIEYKAKNKQGLTTKRLVDVSTIESEDSLTLNINGEVTQLVAGNDLKIAESLEVLNASGKSEISITATLKSDSSISYAVNTETLTFSPYYAGEYEIVYRVSDYLTTAEVRKTCVVTANPTPFILTDFQLPKKLIVGNTYKFPTEVYGYDLSSGTPERIKATLSVTEGSKNVAVQEGYYTAADQESVTVVYSIEKNSHTATRSFTIPTVKVKKSDGSYDVTKFFEADSASANVFADYSFVHFTMTEDTAFEFLNPLRADALEMMMSFQTVGFTQYSFYLSEISNPEKSVKVTLATSGKNLKVYVNDVFQTEINKGFSDYKTKSLSISYDGESIRLGESANVVLTEYENGEKFVGFEDGVSLRFEVSGVTQDSEIALVKLNNQFMYDFENELIEPEVIVDMLLGERELGATITLTPASAYDVLTGIVRVSLQVKNSDNKVVTANDGTELDFVSAENTYSFTLSAFGQYTISYKAQDVNGNTVDYAYVITCVDTQCPEVSLSSDKITAKVGDVVQIPEVSATDDLTISEELSVYKCLILPDDRIVTITSDQIQVTKTGVYKIYYSVYDATGNVTQVYCELIVTE